MNDTTATPGKPDLNADPGEPHEIRALMRKILVDHAVSLDRMYLDFTEYAAEVFADSPYGSQTYLHLALRAQTSCRSALQAVIRVDQAVEAAAAKAAQAAEAGASGLDPALPAPARKAARRPRRAATH